MDAATQPEENGSSSPTPRVIIVGGGFAGYHAARALARLAPHLDVTLINQTDYFLYLPLLPEVAAGLLDPRRICVSLRAWPGRVRLELGTVDRVDVAGHTVSWLDPDGRRSTSTYDRLLLTVGSVNKLLPIPGVADTAHGFRGVAEALYVRDHIVRQMELAAMTTDADERAQRCTFVVVGAGYTGTEVVAQGQLMTSRIQRDTPALAQQPIRWLLLDTADRVLPELDRHLSRAADCTLRQRGVELRMGQSVANADSGGVTLTTGERVSTRSLIWCVGVRPDPVVAVLNMPTTRGRLVVDEYLAVPNIPSVYACGDCAGVPDLTRPGQVTGMTAQHAQRQGRRAALNLAASLGYGTARPYRHRDLGFLVDLGGGKAAANPLRVPLSGLPAKAVTRAYHLYALPDNRLRTALDWTVNAFSPPRAVQLGLVRGADVLLDATAPH